MPDLVAADPMSLVPGFSALDALRIAAWFVVCSWLPGRAWLELTGLRPSRRIERAALAAIVGVVWCTACLFFAGVWKHDAWHALIAPAPWIVERLLCLRRGASLGQMPRLAQVRRRLATGELGALALIATFVAWHVIRVAQGVALDETGVRFYDAWYSDKMVNMSVAVALIEETPPRSLRMAGHGFPYHYFPHVWIAGAARQTGVDVVNVFWFHAAALGIGISGLAVVAFLRQVLRSYRWATVGLALFGLLQFSPEARPLELSIPLLLTGMLALRRRSCGGPAKWSVVAALLWGVMPLYEVFHALTLLAALGLWWLGAVWRARGALRPAAAQLTRRAGLVGATTVVAVGAVGLSMWGVRPAGATKVVAKNSFHDSYKHEWIDAAGEHGPSSWTARLYAWKRGKAEPTAADGRKPVAAGPGKRIIGELVYWIGFVGYALLRWLNLAAAGILAIVAAVRSGERRSSILVALIAAVAVVGFGLPCVVTWGHDAGGRWWETPNIYRPTTLAYLLLLLVGVAAIRTACAAPRKPVSWLVLSCAAWQLFTSATAAVALPQAYHHVKYEQLAALAFLRQATPRDDTVIHPWSDELIHAETAARPAAWIYKRHFTLGSNLAARPMYYEGREDHLFIGGFVDPAEVYRRRDLRSRFYEEPDARTVNEVLTGGQVRWVVADAENPAPQAVQRSWPVAYRNAAITVYRAPRSESSLAAAASKSQVR